jgi:hypothetical protein
MSAKEEIKKVLLTEPLKYVLALLMPPLVTFILASLPPARDRILAAVPGWLLLMLASAELVVIGGLVTYARYLRKERRGLGEKLETRPAYMFGVGWDEKQNPLCPSCGTRLSVTYEGVGVVAVSHFPSTRGNPKLRCLRCCNKPVEIIDDEGRELSLSEAKRRVQASLPPGGGQ